MTGQEISDLLKSLGFFTLGSLTLGGTIAYIGRSAFNQYLKLNLEKHKSKILHENEVQKVLLDKEMETFRMELSKINYEHQVKFSNLHTNQADTIKKFYKKLVKANKALLDYTRPVRLASERPKEEVAKDVFIFGNEFIDYFEENEIIFNERTCEIVQEIRLKYVEVWIIFQNAEFSLNSGVPELRVKQFNEASKAYHETMQKEIPNLKNELKKEFRKQMGQN